MNQEQSQGLVSALFALIVICALWKWWLALKIIVSLFLAFFVFTGVAIALF